MKAICSKCGKLHIWKGHKGYKVKDYVSPCCNAHYNPVKENPNK